MDTIYIAIIVVLALLLFLHFRDHVNVEEGFLPPDYFQKPGMDPNQVAVNLDDSKNKNFKNFGTLGDFPPNPLCQSCNLNYNCMNAPYTQLSDKYQNVCLRCGDPLKKNYYQMQEKIMVMGRSAGRPRQCRLIN